MNSIPFSDLPSSTNGYSQLFLDYIENNSKVETFFNGNFKKDSDWKSLLKKVTNRSLDRSAIAQILSRQNKENHCGVKTLANIDLLLNDNTVAVVTGQQVGIFTGPLYTIYKTLTCLKLVENLNERFPDYSFVPIFWLEGEDHDIDEVISIHLMNQANDLMTATYDIAGKGNEKNLGAVGKLRFEDKINLLFDSLQSSLVQTEYTQKVMDLFRVSYQTGMSFNKSFMNILNDLLPESGLIFLDPNDVEVKQLLKPLFKRELSETPRFCQLVIDQSARLEKAYHAQIKPKSINLFFFHNEGRYLLEPKSDGYSLKGTRQHLSKEQVEEALENTPEKFSSNVVLRPICQDTLLPTIAYVAGPSEIAYFAQLKTLYEDVGIPEPMIFPRASVTIVEEKVEKVLQRYSLRISEILHDVEIAKAKVANQISDINIDEIFGGSGIAIREILEQMKPGLQQLDPTLLGAVQNTQQKFESHLTVLREKSVAAQKRQHEVSLRQVEKAANHLFPGGQFQERTINILHFLNKYGLEFVRWLYTEMKIDVFEHQIIFL
ncbi:MAG: bacillithiol biosynthesis cysteine-adding enzyme BshC [bacterium]